MIIFTEDTFVNGVSTDSIWQWNGEKFEEVTSPLFSPGMVFRYKIPLVQGSQHRLAKHYENKLHRPIKKNRNT